MKIGNRFDKQLSQSEVALFFATLDKVARAHLSDICDGIYIYGSVFSNDFIAGVSDIDFSGFLNVSVSDNVFQRVAAFHEELRQASRLANCLEGEYYFLDKDDIWGNRATIVVDQAQHPELDTGTIDPDIIEFIKSKGITAYGAEAQYLLPYVNTSDVRDYFERYINEIIQNFPSLRNKPSLLWHKLLNACRAKYCIVNGFFVEQKRLTAKWAMARYSAYSTLIKKALNIRDGLVGASIADSQEENKILEFLQELRDPLTMVQELPCGLVRPMRAEIQMTTKCNCNCPHCGYFTINQHYEKSSEMIISFMTELKSHWGWLDRVLFEGGEPTVEFETLLDCISGAKKLQIPNIQINTNLINVSFEKLHQLISAGCNYFEVSVDAFSRELWLKMRGLERDPNGSKKYDGFIDSLKWLCAQPGVVVDFNYTPTVTNFDECEAVYDLACQLGARYFSFQNLVCTTEEIKAISLSEQQLQQKIEKLDLVSSKYSFPATILLCCSEALNSQSFTYARDKNHFIEEFKCSCGQQYIYLNYLREVRLCCFGKGLVLGTYQKGNIGELWDSKSWNTFYGCPICK